MANISSYPLITPKASDLVLVTETYDINAANPVVGNPTRSATAGSLSAINNTYSVYTALLTQSGVTAPVPTVLQNNTGGTFVWTYINAGSYLVTATDATLDVAKTIVFLNNGSSSYVDPNMFWSVNASNQIDVRCTGDNVFTKAAFEIRIYK